MHYLLIYDVADGYLERRGTYRADHLQLLEEAEARGELMLADALADPVDGAVFLFRGAGPEAAEAFAKADPYVVNGLITRWRVRKWPTVVGAGAATPLSSASFR